jgi:hypothetical protein
MKAVLTLILSVGLGLVSVVVAQVSMASSVRGDLDRATIYFRIVKHIDSKGYAAAEDLFKTINNINGWGGINYEEVARGLKNHDYDPAREGCNSNIDFWIIDTAADWQTPALTTLLDDPDRLRFLQDLADYRQRFPARTENGRKSEALVVDILRKAQVLELLKSLDSAIVKKDAKGACTNFADDAIITIVLHEGGQKYTDTYDKKKYQAILEAGFPNFEDYTAKRSETKVQITADGKTASAESTFVEEFRRNGIKMGSSSKESYSFVLRDGRIVIKSMSNVAKMQ